MRIGFDVSLITRTVSSDGGLPWRGRWRWALCAADGKFSERQSGPDESSEVTEERVTGSLPGYCSVLPFLYG